MAYLGLFLNWLATHLVSLALLVFLLLGVYFRQPLFEGTANPVEGSAPTIPSPVATTSDGPRVADGTGTRDESLNAADVGTTGDSSTVTSSAPKGTDAPPIADPVFRPTGSSSAPFVPKNVTTDRARFRNPADDSLADRREAELVAQRWLMAGRNAFSREDFDSAEIHYLRYLSERPEDPEAFAELGNLYRVQGRTGDALDAYYEAAVRFRELDEWGEVQQLGGILDRAGDARGAYLLGFPR